MKTFLTSDLHFFHRGIIGYCNRPFGSVEHMNDALVKNWNALVTEKDEVFFLGDFSFGHEEETAEVLRSLHGTKHLIAGNHDRRGRAEKLFNVRWAEFFASRADYARVKREGVKMVLCHFPFASWERGYFNFHGHLHSPNGYRNKRMQYDVGADANGYAPLLLADAIKRAEAGE